MRSELLIILFHQAIFQGMFFAKNISLRGKIGKQIKGNNREANRSICFFALFIGLSAVLSCFGTPVGTVRLVTDNTASYLAILLLFVNLIFGAASLIGMKDSWRVGVLEGQHTDLIEEGIYRFSRNPYFVSYLAMFVAYAVLLQNMVLLGLSFIGFTLIHAMIKKEERHLTEVHGQRYIRYKESAPRYFVV